jgi:uncharacterized protein (DUF2062 family)
MRLRLYFVLPDASSARKIANDLLMARVEDRHMHFLARKGTDLGELHEASFLQKTDIRHGAAVGMMGGGLLGVAVGLLVIFFPPTGAPMQLAIVLVTSLLGALFGAWVSSMVATAIPNSHLRQFETDIAQGHILLMVDVPSRRVDEIRALVKRTHPEAEAQGREPTIPAFP